MLIDAHYTSENANTSTKLHKRVANTSTNTTCMSYSRYSDYTGMCVIVLVETRRTRCILSVARGGGPLGAQCKGEQHGRQGVVS